MEYTQEGDVVREERKINLKKLLGIVVAFLVFGGTVYVVQKITHVYILLYVWPVILAAVSVYAAFKWTRDDSED